MFPIAEWIVSNWWALLNEPCRTEKLPKASAATYLPWIKRHCLRAAESGLLLPALYFFNDGRGIRAEWEADEQEALPNMPGWFGDSGLSHLDTEMTKDALARFVSEILERVKEARDERVHDLNVNWSAIQGADADEARFCLVAGRMGLNPYDPKETSDALGKFIEQALDDPDLPLARDLTEVAEAESVAGQWTWVRNTTKALKLGPSPKPPPIS